MHLEVKASQNIPDFSNIRKWSAWFLFIYLFSPLEMLVREANFGLKGFVGVVYHCTVHCMRVHSWQMYKQSSMHMNKYSCSVLKRNLSASRSY